MFDSKDYTFGKYLILCFGNTMLIDIINRLLLKEPAKPTQI